MIKACLFILLFTISAIDVCTIVVGQSVIGPLHPIKHDSLLQSLITRFQPDSAYLSKNRFNSWFHYYQYLNAIPYAARENDVRAAGFDGWGFSALQHKFKGEPFNCPLETWNGWTAVGTKTIRQNETALLASCAKSRILAIDFHPQGLVPDKYRFLAAVLDSLWQMGYHHLAFPVLSPEFTSPSCLYHPCGIPIRDLEKALFFRLALQMGFKIIQYPPLHSEIYVPDSGTKATDPFLGYYTCQDRFSDEMVAEWIFQLNKHPTMKMLLFEPPMSTISFCLAEAKIPVCSWRFAYDAQLMPNPITTQPSKANNNFAKSIGKYAIDEVRQPQHIGYPTSPKLPASLAHWLIRIPVASNSVALSDTSQLETWKSIDRQVEQWVAGIQSSNRAKDSYCLSVYWLTDEDIANQTTGIPQSIPVFEAIGTSPQALVAACKENIRLRKGTYRFCLINAQQQAFCAKDWVLE